MEDQVAGQPAPAASASAPAPAAIDIDKIKAELKVELQKDMDARVGGFQTVINRLTEENKTLKRQQLPDDERLELDTQDQTDRVAELERKLALMQLAVQFPDEAAVYQALLDADTALEQVQILKALRTPPATPEVEAQVAEVDRNNPAQTTGEVIGRMPDGTPLTGDAAIEYLKQFGPTAYGDLTR